MLYFASTDGVHWDKPDLGVIDVAGRRDHNIVFTSDLVARSVSPLSYGPKQFVTPTTAMACSQPRPIVVDDTVYFYYAALNFPHNVDMARTDPKVLTSGAALATFKRDRFASLETSHLDNGPCRVITKPFTVQHPKLSLNAATWMRGSIRAEVLTRDWQPIAGFSEPEALDIQGDALDHPVRWKENADVSKLVGQEIRLKFYMTRARIHARTLANAARPLGEVEPEYRHDEQGDSTPKLN